MSDAALQLQDFLFQASVDEAENDKNGIEALQGGISNVILEQEIARGGGGIVYKGYQKSLKRQVAVKVLRPKSLRGSGDAERLRQEALAISRLKHPHIVQCFDAGFLEDDKFYIMMEFVPGGNLEEYLLDRGVIDELESLEFVLQTAQGLSTVYEEGIIHRDIKPSNLLLNHKNQITITDFGLALSQQSGRITQKGVDNRNRRNPSLSLTRTSNRSET